MSRSTGFDAERRAAKYLKKQGFKIIEQNRAFKFGEADIIAWDKDVLVFIEVKYRQSDAFMPVEMTVSYKKQRSYFSMANIYSARQEYKNVDMRFDIIAICNDEIKHIKNAFYKK